MSAMPARRRSATSASLARKIPSTSRDTARSRAPAPAVRRASSYSPPAHASDEKKEKSTIVLFVVLVLIRPALGLRWPVLLVVADQTFDVQPPEQLGREAAGGEILDLPLELALLADHRVDLAEARAAQHLLDAAAQIDQRRAHQLARRGVELEAEPRDPLTQRAGALAIGGHQLREAARVAWGRLARVERVAHVRRQFAPPRLERIERAAQLVGLGALGVARAQRSPRACELVRQLVGARRQRRQIQFPRRHRFDFGAADAPLERAPIALDVRRVERLGAQSARQRLQPEEARVHLQELGDAPLDVGRPRRRHLLALEQPLAERAPRLRIGDGAIDRLHERLVRANELLEAA